MAEKANNKFVSAIKRFFVQTFRRHTGKEYTEFLSRGVQKREDRVNRQYAWVYVRLFAMLFVLYAVFLLIMRFTENELFVPTIIILAAFLFNLPFLVLLYELSPDNGISLIAVCAVMLIGGTCADVIVQVLYSFFAAPNSLLKAVYSGFFEELAKAGVTIIIIAVTVKSRQPYFGFLVGAAVGCGFSVVEDMGYVFLLSNELPAFNLTTIIEVTFIRGGSAFCTHALWTGIVGWVYCYFERHKFNLLYYLVLMLVCALHIGWDLPLSGMWYYVATIGDIIITAAVAIPIIVSSRRKAMKAHADESGEFFETDTSSLDDERPEYFAHAAHLSLTFGAVLMAVCAIVFCWMPFKETYYTQVFGDSEEFVAYMQEDLTLAADWHRLYDEDFEGKVTKNVDADGNVTKIFQIVEVDGYEYAYGYTVYDLGDGTAMYGLADIAVKITKDGVYTWVYAENLYNSSGSSEPYASFFRVRGDVTGFNFSVSGDEVTVFMYDPSFKRDLTAPQYKSLFCTFAAIGGSALCAFAVLEIIARRIKNNVKD